MKVINLTQGKIAVVDDCDFIEISSKKWHLNNGYAYSFIDGKRISMHMYVLRNIISNNWCDHIDMDKLNNRKNNLRICTPSQNRMNTKERQDNKSGYKGISWDRERGKWLAQIQINSQKKNLGRFKCIKQAIEAYNQASKSLFGEFAYVNKISV